MMMMESLIVLKGGQYVFLHNYPKDLNRSDLTKALLDIDNLKVRFLEFTPTDGNVVIAVKSIKDKNHLFDLGFIEVVSEENPEVKHNLKFYWGGDLPEPDPPIFLLQNPPRWTLTKNSQLSQLIKLINNANNIVVFTGEGVAEDLSIPDFRPPKGVDWEIYNEFTNKNLLDPTKISVRSHYWQHHSKLYDDFLAVSPGSVHQLLAYLEEQNKLSLVISQNIDGLHEITIKDPSRLLSLNGSERSDVTCLNPQCTAQPVSRAIIHDAFKASGVPPQCSECSTPLKSMVLSFGEDIDQLKLKKAIVAISRTDLLIVIGSALMYSPACNLIELVERFDRTMVTINPNKTVFDGAMTLAIHGGCQEICESTLAMLQSGKVKVEMPLQQSGRNRLGSKRETPIVPKKIAKEQQQDDDDNNNNNNNKNDDDKKDDNKNDDKNDNNKNDNKNDDNKNDNKKIDDNKNDDNKNDDNKNDDNKNGDNNNSNNNNKNDNKHNDNDSDNNSDYSNIKTDSTNNKDNKKEPQQ